MKRTVVFRAAFAAVCLACAALPASAQEVRLAGIEPDKPAPGSAFVLTVEVTGASADVLVPVEPELSGPARYDGADIRPDGGDASSALVAYRFTATGSGRAYIRNVSVRVKGRVLKLGDWVLDIVEPQVASVRRHGSWQAPDLAWARQPFMVSALGPDREAAPCPPFSVEGAIVEPRPGTPGAYSVVVLEPGSWRLPPLEIKDASGTYTLGVREVAIRALPPAASVAKSVGGPWKLELVAPRASVAGKPGDTMAWEIRAVGGETSGFAEAPSIVVTGPSGEPVPLDPGVEYHSRLRGSQAVVGARGVFNVAEPGDYTVRPEPYAWFDTDSGTIRRAMAPVLRFSVKAPAPPVLAPPAAMVEYAARALAAKSGGLPAGSAMERASVALAAGDWPAARSAVYLALGIPERRGALAQATLGPKEAMLAACVGFIAGDSAEAYGILLRLGKTAFPPPGADELAEAAAGRFGNLGRPAYVLPPFGYTCIAAAFASVIAALVLAARKRRALAVALVAVLLVGVAVASIAERSVPRFVSLGAIGHKVPSVHAKASYELEAGRSGRVLHTAGDWLFVEPDDMEAAWISTVDVVRY